MKYRYILKERQFPSKREKFELVFQEARVCLFIFRRIKAYEHLWFVFVIAGYAKIVLGYSYPHPSDWSSCNGYEFGQTSNTYRQVKHLLKDFETFF
jgi:hypothetical protein